MAIKFDPNATRTNPFAVPPAPVVGPQSRPVQGRPAVGAPANTSFSGAVAGNPFAAVPRNQSFNGQSLMADAPGGLGADAIRVGNDVRGEKLFFSA